MNQHQSQELIVKKPEKRQWSKDLQEQNKKHENTLKHDHHKYAIV